MDETKVNHVLYVESDWSKCFVQLGSLAASKGIGKMCFKDAGPKSIQSQYTVFCRTKAEELAKQGYRD